MSVVGGPFGIAEAIFTASFSLTIGIIKKLLSITRKKKRKSTIRFLCWLKVNSLALKLSLVSQALIDLGISHEEFITIMKERKNTRR